MFIPPDLYLHVPFVVDLVFAAFIPPCSPYHLCLILHFFRHLSSVITSPMHVIACPSARDVYKMVVCSPATFHPPLCSTMSCAPTFVYLGWNPLPSSLPPSCI